MKNKYIIVGLLFLSLKVTSQVTDLGQICTSSVIEHLKQNPLAVGEEVWWGGLVVDTIVREMGDGVSRTDFYANGQQVQYGKFAISDGMELKLIGTSVGYDVISTPGGSIGEYSCSSHQPFTLFIGNTSPVTWSDAMKVEAIDNKTLINFSTSQETNTSHFCIEHSINQTDYQTLGILDGLGDSTQETMYEYIHENPKVGINFYRIKQVDNDGRFTYSSIAYATIANKKRRIYPNPATEQLNVEVTNEGYIQIYNLLGLKLAEYKLVEGKNTINLTQVEKGLNILRFPDGSFERILTQ